MILNSLHEIGSYWSYFKTEKYQNLKPLHRQALSKGLTKSNLMYNFLPTNDFWS